MNLRSAPSTPETRPEADGEWITRFVSGRTSDAIEQPRPGKALPGHGIEQPRFGKALPGHGIEQPRLGKALPGHGIEQPRLGKALPGHGIEQPRLGKALPGHGIEQPRLGKALPSHGIDEAADALEEASYGSRKQASRSRGTSCAAGCLGRAASIPLSWRLRGLAALPSRPWSTRSGDHDARTRRTLPRRILPMSRSLAPAARRASVKRGSPRGSASSRVGRMKPSQSLPSAGASSPATSTM